MTIDKIIEEFKSRFCFKTEILNKKDHKTEIVSYNSDFGFRDFENWLRKKLVEVEKQAYINVRKNAILLMINLDHRPKYLQKNIDFITQKLKELEEK